MDYKEYNDEELLSYIREQNEEANELMFKKYKPLIKNIAQKHYRYNNRGLELSDLIQEGMIALSYAIVSYKSDKDASFYTYAKTCIERRIISIMVGTTRLKNKYLNESLPIESDNEKVDLLNFISDDSFNPLTLILDYEKEQEVYELAKKILTTLEFQVFELKLSGFDYKEIADILEVDSKIVDNALQRIRKKLKNNLKVD